MYIENVSSMERGRGQRDGLCRVTLRHVSQAHRGAVDRSMKLGFREIQWEMLFTCHGSALLSIAAQKMMGFPEPKGSPTPGSMVPGVAVAACRTRKVGEGGLRRGVLVGVLH